MIGPPDTAAVAAVLIALLASCDDRTQSTDGVGTRARAIHDAVITIDTHDDIPPDFATAAVDPLDAARQVNLQKMEAGGLDVAFFIVFVGQTERTPENEQAAKDAAMTKFEAIHRMTETYPDRIELAYSADDVERIHASGKLVAAIGIESGYVIGRDLSLLARYHELGARYMTLAHGGHNDIADSATPREALGDAQREHSGLSAFGEQVVAEMNRLGILVDVSHISKEAALHAMRVSRAPVIASHSNATALAPHPRNMDDETLLALKADGGVIQMVALDSYVKVQPPERAEALLELQEAVGYEGGTEGMSHEQMFQYDRGLEDLERRFPSASVSDFVDHIDYAVGLIGIDHVGISSDFDGGGGVAGWRDASETFNVTAELVRRGYTEQEIAELWGGNLLRVWRETERVAAELDR